MGNVSGKYLHAASIGFSDQGTDVLCKIRAAVHNSQQNAVCFQFGVNLPVYLLGGLQELFQAFGGYVQG